MLKDYGSLTKHSLFIVIIIIIIIIVTGLFFLLPLFNQRWSPPLRLQVSHCSAVRIMCDVPSTAVFCSESTEWFLVWLPNFN